MEKTVGLVDFKVYELGGEKVDTDLLDEAINHAEKGIPGEVIEVDVKPITDDEVDCSIRVECIDSDDDWLDSNRLYDFFLDVSRYMYKHGDYDGDMIDWRVY